MRQRTLIAALVTTLLSLTVVVVSVLSDLRSPDGTTALGRTLADDPAIQALLAETIVDALMADVTERSTTAAVLAPLVRPILTVATETTVASPAGRAAVASTLADAIQQTTRRGPIVIDLRAATLAAAAEAPAPLDTIARRAIEQGDLGLIVLGGGDAATSATAPQGLAGRVAGLPSGGALMLASFLLVVGVGATIAGGADGRRERLLGAGLPLATVGAVSALAVRLAPETVVSRAVTTTAVDSGPLADVLPTLVAGLAQLLGPTGTVSLVMLVAGVVLTVVAYSTDGRRPAAGPPPRW